MHRLTILSNHACLAKTQVAGQKKRTVNKRNTTEPFNNETAQSTVRHLVLVRFNSIPMWNVWLVRLCDGSLVFFFLFILRHHHEMYARWSASYCIFHNVLGICVL